MDGAESRASSGDWMEEVNRHENDERKNLAFRPLVQLFASTVDHALSSGEVDARIQQAFPRLVSPVGNLAEEARGRIEHFQRLNHAYGAPPSYQWPILDRLPSSLKGELERAPAHRERLRQFGLYFERMFTGQNGRTPVESALARGKAAAEVGMLVPPDDPHRSTLLLLFSFLIGPIGEHGPELQRQLAVAASVLFELALSEEFTGAHGALFPPLEKVGIAREDDGPSERVKYTDVQRSLAEGIVSVYQSLLLLTGSRVEGLTGEALAQRLLLAAPTGGNGMVAQFARLSPPGYIGPTSNCGRLFVDDASAAGPVRLLDSGELGFTAPFLGDLRAYGEVIKTATSRTATPKPVTYNGIPIATSHRVAPPKSAVVNHHGCPVARKSPDGEGGSSLQRIADLYLQVFRSVSGVPG